MVGGTAFFGKLAVNPELGSVQLGIWFTDIVSRISAAFFVAHKDISHTGATNKLIKSLVRGDQDIILFLITGEMLLIGHRLEVDAVDLLAMR